MGVDLVTTTTTRTGYRAQVNVFKTPAAPAATPTPTPTPTPVPTPTQGQAAGGTPFDPTTGLQGSQQDAWVALNNMLTSYGLATLAPKVMEYVKGGYDNNTIGYLVQTTPEWHERFKGNDIRAQQGLAVLQPGDYLAVESAYKDVLRNAGIAGNYNAGDFATWIGNDVSGKELGDRVQSAQQLVQSVDPNVRNAFQAYYGIDSSHLTQYFLDPQKGEDFLAQQAAASNIGAAALDQGLHLTPADRALQYAQAGIGAQQAADAYGKVAGVVQGGEGAIAQRFGQTYDQSDAENEFLGGLASAQRKRQQLNAQEQGLFSGQGGAGNDFYHPDYGLAVSSSDGQI